MRSCPVIRCPPGGASEMISRALEGRLRDLLKHPWTYQAMCHDVLGMQKSKLSVPVEQEGGAPPKPRTYDVEWTDSFFNTHAGNPFPVVAEAVSKEIETFEEKRSQMNQEPLDADAGIGAAMNALPEMTEKKRCIDMHTNIATALLAEIQSRSLDRYIEIENELPSKMLSSLVADVCKVVQDTEKGTSLDKSRLVLSFLLTRPELSDEQRKTLTDALEAGGHVNMRAVAYLKKLASFQQMKGALAPPAAAQAPAAVMNAVLGQQFGGLARTLTSSVAGAVNSGLTVGLQGIKMVLPSKSELPSTRIVDALLENRSSDLVDGYMYLDPRPTGDARAQNLKSVVVFAVGGGNYVEAHTLMEWASKSGVQATYGATDMTSAASFYEQLSALG